jgi:hypothetical protein
VLSPVCEGKAAARDEVLDGLRDDEVSAVSGSQHAGADGDRQATGLAVDDLALTDVHSRAYLDPEGADTPEDFVCAMNRASWTGKAGVKAVASSVVLLTPQRASASRTAA